MRGKMNFFLFGLRTMSILLFSKVAYGSDSTQRPTEQASPFSLFKGIQDGWLKALSSPLTSTFRFSLGHLLRPDELMAWLPTWYIARPHGVIDDQVPPAELLEADASRVFPIVQRMKRKTFFRIFKVDLTQECPFWAASAMCMNPQGCSVCECGDDEIPKTWRQKPTEEFVDRRHAVESFTPWEPSYPSIKGAAAASSGFRLSPDIAAKALADGGSSKSTYVDLLLNSPSHTGYLGGHIWLLIYQENCLHPPASSTSSIFPFNSLSSSSSSEGVRTSKPSHHPTKDLDDVDESGSSSGEDICEDEDNFFRIFSGMHSNIAALSSEYHFFPGQKSRLDSSDVQTISSSSSTTSSTSLSPTRHNSFSIGFFRDKLGQYENRIANLYFTFSILLRAVCSLSYILEECNCETGNRSEDLSTRADLLSLLNEPFASCDEQYMGRPLFTKRSGEALQQFHNITRILDCVECEKCRLHGKLKMTALGLALKICAKDYKVTKLERNEVVALINALGYFAEAVRIVQRFDERLFAVRACMLLGIVMLMNCIALMVLRMAVSQGRRSVTRAISVLSETIGSPTRTRSSRSDTVMLDRTETEAEPTSPTTKQKDDYDDDEDDAFGDEEGREGLRHRKKKALNSQDPPPPLSTTKPSPASQKEK